jgi:ankyrin repeat protein
LSLTPLSASIYKESDIMHFQSIIFILLSTHLYAVSDASKLKNALHRKSYGLTQVQELLINGCDPNILDEHNISPLTIAITTKHVATVYSLLDAGASISYLETTKQFPLFVALDNWNREIFGALLRRGACTDLTNADGFTVSDVAIELGNKAAQCMLKDSTRQRCHLY